ncbi:MAG: nicotinate-nucleotide adenylyltransferase, partial [Bacteroidales bacterium]|nr:nicotinate-nucleotide adenylyltransferase [Bacteroidales bacterium]
LTGLFFGSFNPVHIGHMAIANYFVEFAKLEELWFVVSPQNPLKEKSGLLPERQRLYMLELAIGKDYRLKTCDIEFSLPKPSYTVNTLTYLREKYPNRNFAIIMGSDNLASFHKWKNYKEIIKHHEILVYPRPSFTPETIENSYNAIWVNAPLMEIAASDLRKAIANGHDMKYFFPEKVWEYIDSMNFF